MDISINYIMMYKLININRDTHTHNTIYLER